jgi:hypothetical protein
MLGQNHFNYGASSLTHLRAIGFNNHTFKYMIVAGAHKLIYAFYLNDTDATSTYLIEIFKKTKRWDPNTYLSCCV